MLLRCPKNAPFPEQFRIPDGNYDIMQLQVTAHDDLGQWYGYGSSVDEVTAGNWSSVLRNRNLRRKSQISKGGN